MPHLPIVAIIDDDVSMREALVDFLQVAGIGCEAFATGAEFLERRASTAFRLVITDLNMPAMDGLELLDRIQRLDEPPPVIIVTSSSDPDVRHRLIQNGAVACLTKPVAHDELLNLVRRLLADPGADFPAGR